MAGNQPRIGKNKLEIENLQISEKSFANYLRTLTSICKVYFDIFSMKS